MKDRLPVLAAFAAALFNASVGLLSRSLLEANIPASDIALYKCAIALLVVSTAVFATHTAAEAWTYLKANCKSLSLCAACGFFILYFFETAAYGVSNISTVVFVLFGSSTITTFGLTALLTRRWLDAYALLSLVMALAGLALIFWRDIAIDSGFGLVLATAAGFGYGCFLVISKRAKIGSGMLPLWGLSLFACLYLWIPVALNGGPAPINLAEHWAALLALALLPTIGGFWCTTYALTRISSEKVQLIELTEPLIATFFASMFLGEQATSEVLAGGLLIIISIYVSDRGPTIWALLRRKAARASIKGGQL